MVIGHISGRTPGARKLSAWQSRTCIDHSSNSLLDPTTTLKFNLHRRERKVRQFARRPPEKISSKRPQHGTKRQQLATTPSEEDNTQIPPNNPNQTAGEPVKPQTFIWQPKTTQNKSQTTTITQPITGDRRYQTPNLYNSFWSALASNRIPEATTTNPVKIRVFYRKRDGLLETLTKIQGHSLKQPVAFQLPHGLEEKAWKKSARNHMTKETMLHMRIKIVLKQKHGNPLRIWEDAHWLYTWNTTTPRTALCIITALLKYNEEVCTIRHSHGLQWTTIPVNLQNFIPRFLPHNTKAWDIESNELSSY